MTTKEWKRILTQEWLSRAEVRERYGIDPDKTFEEQFSAVSVESLLFYAQAFGLMVMEKLMQDTAEDLEARFERLRPHTLSWYAEKIKAFQLDYTLPQEGGAYETIDEASRVVRYCSLVERDGVLRAKVAGEKGGKPTALPTATVEKVAEYMARVKYLSLQAPPYALFSIGVLEK